MNEFIIFGMATITFTNRYAFFIQSFNFQLNEKMQRFLSFSSYAILTAIWTPIVFKLDLNQGFGHAGYDYLIATSLAVILATLKTPSILLIIITSTVFFCLRSLFIL